jgi:hypothetical protein
MMNQDKATAEAIALCWWEDDMIYCNEEAGTSFLRTAEEEQQYQEALSRLETREYESVAMGTMALVHSSASAMVVIPWDVIYNAAAEVEGDVVRYPIEPVPEDDGDNDYFNEDAFVPQDKIW